MGNFYAAVLIIAVIAMGATAISYEIFVQWPAQDKEIHEIGSAWKTITLQLSKMPQLETVRDEEGNILWQRPAPKETQ